MNVEQLTTVPDGLRAMYVVVVREDSEQGYSTHIIDRLVDAVCILNLDANDIRTTPGERQGAKRGRKSKIVGVIMEGAGEPKPASLATGWFERLYGDDLIQAKFIGYTRSDHTVDEIMMAVVKDKDEGVEFPEGEETPTMRQTRRYWAKVTREALDGIIGHED